METISTNEHPRVLAAASGKRGVMNLEETLVDWRLAEWGVDGGQQHAQMASNRISLLNSVTG